MAILVRLHFNRLRRRTARHPRSNWLRCYLRANRNELHPESIRWPRLFLQHTSSNSRCGVTPRRDPCNFSGITICLVFSSGKNPSEKRYANHLLPAFNTAIREINLNDSLTRTIKLFRIRFIKRIEIEISNEQNCANQICEKN